MSVCFFRTDPTWHPGKHSKERLDEGVMIVGGSDSDEAMNTGLRRGPQDNEEFSRDESRNLMKIRRERNQPFEISRDQQNNIQNAVEQRKLNKIPREQRNAMMGYPTEILGRRGQLVDVVWGRKKDKRGIGLFTLAFGLARKSDPPKRLVGVALFFYNLFLLYLYMRMLLLSELFYNMYLLLLLLLSLLVKKH